MDTSERKDAIFNITNCSLSGTKEWHLQTKLSWILSLILVLYSLYGMNINIEMKALSIISFLFTCYAAVNISVTIRNRAEANKLEKFAKNTNIYVSSNITTLRGSLIKYLFQWSSFLISFIAMIVSSLYINVSAEQRNCLIIAGMMMTVQTFILAKTLRDKEDAEHLYQIYFNK